MNYIIIHIIGGISLLSLFVLYSTLSDLLAKYNDKFTKNIYNAFDIVIMLKTYKKIKKEYRGERKIIVISIILYLITLTTIILSFIFMFMGF